MEEQELVRAAVKEILSEADMSSTTEGMVRKMAAERAGIAESSSSAPWLKKLVKELVAEFINAGEAEEDAEEADEGEGKSNKEKKQKRNPKSLAEGEDHIICQLSAKKSVTVQNFKGKPLVSIREFYEKNGKSLPGKGISLTVEQWEALKKGLPSIKEAIESLQ